MTRYADLATIDPEAGLVDALRILEERQVGQLPVVVDGGRTAIGMVTRRGIVRLIDARMKLGL